MDKQWCEYLIEIVITFSATFLGVLLAIKADNDRDKKNHIDHKTRLAKGIFWEMDKLLKFLGTNTDLVKGEDYFIETHILRDTVGDQIKYFDYAELIWALSELRGQIKELEFKLGVFSKSNIEIATKEYTTVQDKYNWDKIRDKIINECKFLKINCTIYTAEVLKMLRKEMPSINFYKELDEQKKKYQANRESI